MTITSLPVRPAAGTIELLILAVKKGVERGVYLDKDITPLSAVTAVRSPLRHVRLATEAEATSAPGSRNDGNACLVYEFQGRVLPRDDKYERAAAVRASLSEVMP